MRDLTDITRIDLEQNGDLGVIVKFWKAGWQEGDASFAADYEQGAKIYRLLMQIESQGFTCEMCDSKTGRALRGEITRIDFKHLPAGWQVEKFPLGWTARTRPLLTESKPAGFNLPEALAWCRAHGWTVSEWENGARAWKGKMLPVRDDSTIRRMRRENPNSPRDFAFDF